MGKGSNKHLNNILQKAGGGLPRVKVRERLTEAEAFAVECALIAAIGRSPQGPLANLTDGGEGTSGHKFKATAETRARMSAAQKRRKRKPLSRETRLKISLALSGKTLSDAHKEKLRKLRLGWKHPDTVRAKMAKAARGKKRPKFSAEWCRKISESNKGVKRSKQTRQRMSKAQKGRKKSANARAAMSVSAKKAAQRPERRQQILRALEIGRARLALVRGPNSVLEA